MATMKIPVSGKRRRLLASFLERAMPLSSMLSNPNCYVGMSEEESKEVTETLNDIYTFCKSAGEDTNGTDRTKSPAC